MSSITTRAAKGSALTHAEVDANFTNLNSDKAEVSGQTFTGAVVLPAGSATAGGVQVGTGATYKPSIYSPGTDQLAISTGGTGRLFVDASGRVGINTSTFAAVNHFLTVSGYSVLGGLRINGSDTSNSIYQSAAFGISSDNYIAFSTNASLAERLRITAAGNVGIGTSSATQKLDVADGDIALRKTTGGDTSGVTSPVLRIGTQSGDLACFYAISSGAGGPGGRGGDLHIATKANNGSPTDRLVITEAGNVGIGASSPASIFQVRVAANQNIAFNQASGEARIDCYNDAVSAPASLGLNGSDLRFQCNGTERARLDSSGRLLVGTSTSATDNIDGIGYANIVQILGAATGAGLKVGNTADFARINLVRSANVGTNVELGTLSFGAEANSVERARVSCFSETTGGSGGRGGRLVFSTTADGAASPTERMRITSAGHILIGQTTGDFNTVGNSLFSNGTAQFVSSSVPTLNLNRKTGDGVVVQFYRDTNTPGSISVTTSATTYATSSDYRLKENVAEVTDGITRLLQLKPSRFNFLADPDKTVDGFIAHETQEVVPECVTGEKDAVDEDGNPVYQGIDQSKLVPLLTAALQEAIAKIETLEARLTAAGIE